MGSFKNCYAILMKLIAYSGVQLESFMQLSQILCLFSSFFMWLEAQFECMQNRKIESNSYEYINQKSYLWQFSLLVIFSVFLVHWFPQRNLQHILASKFPTIPTVKTFTFLLHLLLHFKTYTASSSYLILHWPVPAPHRVQKRVSQKPNWLLFSLPFLRLQPCYYLRWLYSLRFGWALHWLSF